MRNIERKFLVLDETIDDNNEVESLLNLVFTPQRNKLGSYYFRKNVSRVEFLCKVIKNDYGHIIGSIRYWPVYIGKKKFSCLLLGPLAVHPICQGEGIGAKLILKTLNLAEKYGWERVILVGDESYYSRFGFKKKLAKDLIFPKPVNQDRLLGLELKPGSLTRVKGLVSRFQ
jgi:predicted N-acetyltransferase YhbS